MTTLIIARHGNTFGPDETPTRVGVRTDLPLVQKGREQAAALGRYLKDHTLVPDVVYASCLKRTVETAQIAIRESGVSNPVFQLEIFNEIDYGPDENKTEADVVARIGAQAIQDWNEQAVVPEGWHVDPEELIQNWKSFADQIRAHDDGEVVLVVTSNGVARFAPHITGDFEGFRQHYPLKLRTGALGLFVYEGDQWQVRNWNVCPQADSVSS